MLAGIVVIVISIMLFINSYLNYKKSKNEADKEKKVQIKLLMIVMLISNSLIFFGGIASILADILE